MKNTCDLLDFGQEDECPGQAAHCQRGEHCTRTDEACSLDQRADDHSFSCCRCGGLIRAKLFPVDS